MDPTGSIASELSMDAFVDDTSIGITDYPKEASLSALTMLQLLEKCAQLWQNLLFASGRGVGAVVIRNKSVKISSKILGVMVPFKNNWEEDISRMTKKSDTYARLTMSHRHRHCDANLSHRIIWAPQQPYSLPITSISLKSLESIQKMPDRHLSVRWVYH